MVLLELENVPGLHGYRANNRLLCYYLDGSAYNLALLSPTVSKYGEDTISKLKIKIVNGGHYMFLGMVNLRAAIKNKFRWPSQNFGIQVIDGGNGKEYNCNTNEFWKSDFRFKPGDELQLEYNPKKSTLEILNLNTIPR